MAWWLSIDRERWEGPYATREAAVADGASYYDDGSSFYVCEAEQEGHNVLHIDADRVLTDLSYQYEELGDPDGDGLFATVEPNEMTILSQRLTAVLHAWIEEYGVKTGIFTFKDGTERNEELINP